MSKKIPAHVLPVIVIAQFAGTSLWFAGNAVVDNLIAEMGLPEMFLGYITMAVQAGFIAGTLMFAFLNIADRFSPVRVFLLCAISGAALNLVIIWADSAITILSARFATGFFLAGIYPVGMKIASDWHKEGLGKALGYLVGALVIGTAFPHLLKFLGSVYPWKFVFIGTSALSAAGGVLLYATVKDGPYRTRSKAFKFDTNAILNLFKNKNFRSASFGYFGHMWELYTFWACVPIMLTYYLEMDSNINFSVSLWSFLIIGVGGVSSVAGGYMSIKKGSKWISIISLAGSGICCLFMIMIHSLPLTLFLILMLIWGFFVIPDSPQLSTLVAGSSDPSLVATGLTIVNSIGFAITIISIQFVSYFWSTTGSPAVFLIMALGPLTGIIYTIKYSAGVEKQKIVQKS